ncbi:MAG: hypothetical protein A3J76_06080 [Candidatus Moranbacteria bacterium RBG_13_45_13]|nr:MAG: hypothetical protein A3J76_06080 [Candidatus Moranbacteria bacterium RBG_13_45_13]
MATPGVGAFPVIVAAIETFVEKPKTKTTARAAKKTTRFFRGAACGDLNIFEVFSCFFTFLFFQ